MKAGKHNIKELFQQDVRYFIPTFQRPYVWNQEKQWEPLWDDVRNLAEEYAEQLAEENGNHAVAEEKAGTHFLGAIVLQQVPTPTAEIDRRDVIDGQQRITTLQILLDAAQEVLEEEGHDKEAKRLRRLVTNDEDFADGDARFKLWPTLGDQDAFRVAMTNGQATIGFGKSLIVQAHEFFGFQIREWLNSVEPPERPRLADALHTTLLGLLVLVVIDLKTGDDAYVIFETLNARGTPLLASDLVKNFILQSASAKGDDPDELYEAYWAMFEEDWWREDVQQGRITRPRIDVFLNYWLIARRFEEVASHNVFPLFRDYVSTTLDSPGIKTNLTDIVGDIRHNGQTFRKLEETNGHTMEEQTFLYRWKTLEARVATPLLLELFSADAEHLPEDKRLRTLRALESFLVRRTICRMTTKDYNRLIQELLSRLAGNVDYADEIIVDFLAGQTADSREWPSNEKLIQAMLDLPLYRLLTRGRMRMILEGFGRSDENRQGRGTAGLQGALDNRAYPPSGMARSLAVRFAGRTGRVSSTDRLARATEAHNRQSHIGNQETQSCPFQWAMANQAKGIKGTQHPLPEQEIAGRVGRPVVWRGGDQGARSGAGKAGDPGLAWPGKGVSRIT